MRCYDRDGEPMDILDPRLVDRNYKRIDETHLEDGKWISTVWLGIDHRYGDGPPLIFETMVFTADGEWGELDMQRYSTEEAARAGHVEMVAKWTEATA